MAVHRRKRISQHGLLLGLCWIIYTCSLIGKMNYGANITQVEAYFNVSHADAGMVSTFYFFAYGAGQIINGLFCKKYNLKYVIFSCLFVAGGANIAIGFTKNFEIIKYLWLLNGASLSVLWPGLIRLLSENLNKEEMSRASVVMGTTTATGTFIIYGLSAIFAALGIFKFAFYTAGVCLPLSGVLWICSYEKLTKKTDVAEEETVLPVSDTTNADTSAKANKAIWVTVVLLALFAVAINLIKDGLTTWVPSILNERYGLPASVSILLTLLLPVVGIFGSMVTVTINKYVPDFVCIVTIIFSAIALLTGAIIGLLNTHLVAVTLIGFAVVKCLASCANGAVTSLFPLRMKGKVNSGLIAGVLNGCCYVGSTISSYGFGFVADTWGWNAVFELILGVAIAVVVIGGVYTIVKYVAKKKTNE